MLKIFLCDDDPFFLSLESDLITRCIRRNRLPAEVAGMAQTLSGAVAFLENNPGEYLVFLDLDFGSGQPNGIDISFALKRGGSRVRTVFITNHHELAMEVLKSGAEPFGFLEKGADVEQLSANLLRYIRMALNTLEALRPGEDRPSVILCTGCGEQVKIDIPDILYLEAEKSLSHGITYHTVNGSRLTIISTLDAEAQRLGGPEEGFLRVHRSYLAAKRHIVALRKGYLLLSNRDEIPCSVRMRKEVSRMLEHL